MTMRFSAEFAIRPFLVEHQAEVLEILSGWVDDDNEHVRRLVSEGTRPRLPWGMRLNIFIEDPTSVIELLEKLKDDDSEYVRRSVANNLNDIAKDHADLVADISKKWMIDASKERQKLVRHSLRSLIKSGHKGALSALGYNLPHVNLEEFNLLTPIVKMGKFLEFEIKLTSKKKSIQPLIIDYAIHHQLANGTLSAKVFKWKNIKLQVDKPIEANRRHSFRPITTRRYYEGLHKVEIFINGEVLGGLDFNLEIE